MMSAAADNIENHKDTYAIVGELVLISSALDTLLNQVIVEVLNLGSAPLILPVVATLDPVRKMEILKERASHIRNADWKKGVTRFVDKVESVFKHRNSACHTPAVLEGRTWTLKPIAAAKMLKKLDIEQKKLKHFSFDDLRTAIRTGESALGLGVNLVDNFKRVNAETARRAELAKK
jgi:hypothetical protein